MQRRPKGGFAPRAYRPSPIPRHNRVPACENPLGREGTKKELQLPESGRRPLEACGGCTRKVIGELRDALSSSINAVKRANIIKRTRRLLQLTFCAINGGNQSTTATVPETSEVMSRLQ
jgi:hypothetical protein